jgi:hypothetical protein
MSTPTVLLRYKVFFPLWYFREPIFQVLHTPSGVTCFKAVEMASRYY